MFGKLKYLTPHHPQIFLTFFGFGEKRVFNRERTFFFSFFKKNKKRFFDSWGGGVGKKVIFQNQLFGLLVVRKKTHFFQKPYRPLRVNFKKQQNPIFGTRSSSGWVLIHLARTTTWSKIFSIFILCVYFMFFMKLHFDYRIFP